MNTLNKLEAYSKIKNSKGQIFTATFVKKDGSNRDMNCRLGVKKGINGKGLKYNAFEKLLMPVYDVQKKDYRMLNLNTVFHLRIKKVDYRVA